MTQTNDSQSIGKTDQEIKDKVRISVGSIQLPTYMIKGENRNPVFRSQYGVAHIYPYTLLDDIAARPTVKNYQTLILENRYLRVTVITDLGGRVYSVFDKVSEREVFYKNKVVKFSPLAIRGAFFSGGIEFSFPVAHAPTTADPVNWDIRENEDGSASICFGGLEHISRLRWMIKLTLFPECCALAQDVWLYNPYTIPGRYHYWTNASLDADDKTEFIYPLHRMRSYEFAGTGSWPIARLDLIHEDAGLPGMEGVPMWPAERMHTPMNFRWQKNILAQVSIFGRNVNWDFFGAWQHSTNHGYAHFADHRDVSGMKLWSWGNAGVGVVNQSALTDDGSLYAETQCGAMETQLDFAFLAPSQSRAWREWWLPLRGLGGLTCASVEAGARIHLSPIKESSDELELTVGVCPVRQLENATIVLSVPGKVLLSENATISPEKPWLVKRRISAEQLADRPLHLMVRDQNDRVILDYSLTRHPDPVEAVVAEIKTAAQSSDEYYQLGLKHENFDNRVQALEAYSKSIELCPENKAAYFRLGLMLLRAADFEGAKKHLQQALSLGLNEAHYYIGLIEVYEGRLATAREHFQDIHTDNPLYLAALAELSALSMHEKDWNEAIRLLEQAVHKDGKSLTCLLRLGMALLRQKRLDAARDIIGSVLMMDPLNHVALREMSLLEPNGAERDKLYRMLGDDKQYWLDLACAYLGMGLLEDALLVLEEALKSWEYPCLYYLAAYFSQRINDGGKAQSYLQKAAGAAPDYAFPSRLEEVLALQHALKQNPQDYHAKYYLGNFLYAHQRFEEGVRFWQEALQGLPAFDVIYRNLGLAAWQQEKNLPLAIDLFEKALALNPLNQDLYLHLDDLYITEGLTEKRQLLLDKIKALKEIREDVRKRSILIQVELGQIEEALKIMETEKFVPLEMDQSFHELYVRALMQRAESHLKSDRIEEVINDYKKALEYPENLGVGCPSSPSQAHVLYHLGLAYEKLGRFQDALNAWHQAANEYHLHGSELFKYVQMSLDKLNRYSELGLEL